MNRLMRDGTADPVLWQALREGSRSALETLYKRHYPSLYRYGCKICPSTEVVQDCLQDLFFQLWVKKEGLQEVKSVRFYLMKWLKRDLVRQLTGKNSSQKLVVPLENDDNGVEAVLDDFFEEKEFQSAQAQLIKRALGELTNKEREVVYLRFFMNLPYEEICQIMNVSYQVVMNYMHRAMKALRENAIFRNMAGLILLFQMSLVFLSVFCF
jgi:RNA polymerase sigma factor (sigma-70 family)